MSAYVVTKETIDRAVSALLTTRDFSGRNATLLGRDIWSMNIDAVEARYGGDSKVERAEMMAYTFSDPVIGGARPLFGNPQPIAPKGKVLLKCYKALRCLIYQCSEGQVPETLLYKRLERSSGEIAHDIVSDSAEYRAESWGS